MITPDFEHIQALSNDYKLVPICREYYADMETPIRVFKKLQRTEYSFLLESVNGSDDNMRYSFIGRSPFLILKSYGHHVVVRNKNGTIQEQEGDPQTILQSLCDQYRAPTIDGMPSFSGGAVGYFGYDTVRLQEHLPNIPEDTLELPDFHFMFVDEVIAFDHRRQKLIVIVNMPTEGDLRENYEKALQRMDAIREELETATIQETSKTNQITDRDVYSNMSKDDYCAIVNKAKEYINSGDIFQVVLAQRFAIRTTVEPLQVYRALRVINPSPYMYYLAFDNHQLVGASPERLVRVENGIVQTCPIAGARKRGASDEEDAALMDELQADVKENAEHVMLVDLGRNDVGKVSKFGTVSVKKFKNVQKFSHVMHLVSEVEGTLRDDLTPFDALAAVLPAGTLSGAPKVRAMEIIDELETVKRNCYGGGIGYIGFNGSFDSCITIRTAVFKDRVAYIGAGAGIVYDSVPENEYQECLNKAQAMIRAVEEAGEY